jgi:hypothetical protein
MSYYISFVKEKVKIAIKNYYILYSIVAFTLYIMYEECFNIVANDL